jgi:Bacterial Ig domain
MEECNFMFGLKRKSEGRAGRTARLGASLALGAGVLAGVGGALVASSTPAFAGSTDVNYTCTTPVGAVQLGATISETPNLPATDQWGTTYSETPQIVVNITPALITLAQDASQTSLAVSGVTTNIDASGFTVASQPATSPDTVTVPVNATTLADGFVATFNVPSMSWTTTTGTAQTATLAPDSALSFSVFGAVTIPCTANATPGTIDSVVTHAPVPEPPVVVTPQSASVSNGQPVTIDVLAGATAQNNTVDPTTVAITTPPAVGEATVNPDGTITYTANPALNPSALTSDSFQWTVKAGDGQLSNTGTVNISINFLTCQATSAPCSLNQLLVLPLQAGPITLAQSSSLPVDTFGTCALPPGEVQITGNAQVACSAVNPLTVTNQTGLDTGWTLTGQTTDFVDPADAANTTLNNCDTTATFNNHCIPGGNLGWNPVSAVAHSIVPGDTALVTSGAPISVPGATAPTVSTNPLLEGAAVQPNPVVEDAPPAGLHTAPQTLCSTSSGQAGGTFVCGGELQLAVPASVALPTGAYTATLTLTLTL